MASNNMENILSLLKRRGFIYGSSEIYGGLAGFFDYGPLGSELKKNIKDAWWQDMVRRRDDVVGLDCAIIMNSKVWKASGHVDGFSDPMVDCRESKLRYRADQLYYAAVIIDGQLLGYVSALEDVDMLNAATQQAETLRRKRAVRGEMQPLQLCNYLDATPDLYDHIPSPATGNCGCLTAPRSFNLMFQTHVGAVSDDSSLAYLRPETAQGMFVNFKNVLDTSRLKLPFGIAQMGRSFRNEITPRNFIFRSREFEQMEMEYFIAPNADWQAIHEYWIRERLNWHESIGLPRELLGLDVHCREKLAHYSRACTDITFRYPFGVQELEGIAARGNFDLTQHQNASGKSLEYFDETLGEKYLPHVIEPAVGVDRTFLAIICAAYDEDEIDGEKRLILHLKPRIAPIKAAVFPLVKNKPELIERAQSIYRDLKRRWNVFFDASGAIGRRYRRMDEVGTPYGITVDFQTLEDGTVTLRDRDSTEQMRLSRSEILPFLQSKIDP